MSIKQIFITIIAIVALMGGCAYALDGSNRSRVEAPEELVAMTFDPQVTVLPDPVAKGDYMAACYNMVGQKPGDLAYALELGWKVVCSKSGDPMLSGEGDVRTLGYADSEVKVITLDALSVTYNTIAHEAAHVVDYETLNEVSRIEISKKYGAASWDDASQYWNYPSEMFAENRARCLGFAFDDTFGEMSCDDIELLIEQGSDVDSIMGMQRTLTDVEP
jgi:hypothetical protein